MKILILEDDAPSNEMMEELFKDLQASNPSLEYRFATNLEDAMDKIHKQKFDVIFADQAVPKYNPRTERNLEYQDCKAATEIAQYLTTVGDNETALIMNDGWRTIDKPHARIDAILEKMDYEAMEALIKFLTAKMSRNELLAQLNTLHDVKYGKSIRIPYPGRQ